MAALYVPFRLDGKVALVTGSGRGIVCFPMLATKEKT